jgi:acetylornithine/N-succinyldiaminopimelate aminotransferase
VQCGLGRTGRLFAHQWAGITPDVMAIAKALGGGFPVGACLATERVARAMSVGSHGSTFGGNPLAMAVANAVLDVVLADGFLDRVAHRGEVLRGRLEGLAAHFPEVVEEVRGLGLKLGLKLRGAPGAMVARLREHGLLTVGAGDNVVRLLPPLIVEEPHIDEAAAILERAFAQGVA